VNVVGTHRLAATREEVYAAICDPAMLMAVIPGCEAIEQVGPGDYVGTIALRLPGLAGTFQARVRLVDAVPPDRAQLEGRLEGTAGSLIGRADFDLTRDSMSTVLDYRGQATIQGPLARLDSRFAERLAGTLIDQALRALDERLARSERSAEPAGAPARDVTPIATGGRRPPSEVPG
jgi:uncharacterized protein